jgi:thioredoxin reductase (NADPH)
LHDAVIFERLGLPATLIMTEPFIGLADRFAKNLGMPGYHRVALPHPVATRPLHELRELAHQFVGTVRRHLVEPPERPMLALADGGRDVEDVVVVGSGPAGYTAALYAARANRRPVVIEGSVWGGLLQETTDVENYPGFSGGVLGPRLMQEFRAQAERFGARLISAEATRIEAGTDGRSHVAWVDDVPYRARTLILAMGAEHRKLGVPGELAFGGKGVSYCATCDAPFFRDRRTIIVGGGDSAMEEAVSLAKFAAEVLVVHRRREFRASQVMLDRARSVPNIRWLVPYEVEEIVGNSAVSAARLHHLESGARHDEQAGGVFVTIGHVPRSELLHSVVDLDPEGYVLVQGRSSATSVPGIFAAGDLVDRVYRQAVTAAGSGCQAALDAERYLRARADAGGFALAPSVAASTSQVLE